MNEQTLPGKHRKRHSPADNTPRTPFDLPGPRGLPVLGNLLQLDLKRLHTILERWAEAYGKLYTIRLGRRPVVVVSDSVLVNEALRDRPEGYRRISAIERVQNEIGLGGVFSAEGEQWRRQRPMVNQALNPQHLREFYQTLVRITEKLMNRLQKYADSAEAVAVQNDLMRFTVDATTNLAFGYDVNTLESEGDVIQQHLEKVFPMISRRVNAPFPYWHFIRLPADRALEKALHEIRKAISGFVEHSRARIAENPDLEEHPGNLLEAMLVARDESKFRFSDREIMGNVLTMLLGGEDTTANTLAWMLYFMTEYPEVQARMQLEADSVLGADKLLYAYAKHDQLEYIEAVAFETMRLKSVAPLLFLETNLERMLGTIRLAKGATIFLLLRHCGMQGSAFGEPGRFKPERWLQQDGAQTAPHNSGACMPFGAGPRFCPGRNLAMLEIKSAMAMLCRNFSFSRHPGSRAVDEEFAFVMVPKNLSVRISRRE
ncbi:MAG: cytochrome P450 [Methylococcaceae bacterium]|nr:cytochrome P450 [Methylococcaceae bacterium]